MNNKKAVWISWERQIRSIELADYFECQLVLIIDDGNFLIRYLKSSIKTISVLRKHRPSVLFVQNPSLFLAALAVVLKVFFKYKLVVDRHTNFKFDKRKLPNLKWKIFWCLSNFTLKNADYTIVTNKPLQRLVKQLGGNALVLQDKFPNMMSAAHYPVKKGFKFSSLFVCTYAYDEPVDEVIDAFHQLGPDYVLYLSGNWAKKWTQAEVEQLPTNIVPTGFLTDEEYKSLMRQVDNVIVFTTNDYTLTCGAYEALSLNKPALLSNKKSLVHYFSGTCQYCDEGDPLSIQQGVKSLFDKQWIDSSERQKMLITLKTDWEKRATRLKDIIFEVPRDNS